jgi:hypothetical protein
LFARSRFSLAACYHHRSFNDQCNGQRVTFAHRCWLHKRRYKRHLKQRVKSHQIMVMHQIRRFHLRRVGLVGPTVFVAVIDLVRIEGVTHYERTALVKT